MHLLKRLRSLVRDFSKFVMVSAMSVTCLALFAALGGVVVPFRLEDMFNVKNVLLNYC